MRRDLIRALLTLAVSLLLLWLFGGLAAGAVPIALALNNFSPGQFVPAAWAPRGANFFILQIKESTLDESCLLFDVTHSGTGGIRARIAGPIDYAGTVNADLDLDLTPYAPLSLHAGNNGVIGFYFNATRFAQIPARIEKVHYQSATDSEVKYSFDAKADALSGLVVFPAL